jgi:hypothetical protein
MLIERRGFSDRKTEAVWLTGVPFEHRVSKLPDRSSGRFGEGLSAKLVEVVATVVDARLGGVDRTVGSDGTDGPRIVGTLRLDADESVDTSTDVLRCSMERCSMQRYSMQRYSMEASRRCSRSRRTCIDHSGGDRSRNVKNYLRGT